MPFPNYTTKWTCSWLRGGLGCDAPVLNISYLTSNVLGQHLGKLEFSSLFVSLNNEQENLWTMSGKEVMVLLFIDLDLDNKPSPA